ncbi:MAG TPA: ROK family protein [Saprospiraceae bacterium]|nr:ROK family protein [Saprospiraceae bacterium]
MKTQRVLGVDFGASGIKGAVVHVETGELVTDRLRFPTPEPSTPVEVAKIFKQMTEQLNWQGLIGCGFPAIIKQGVALTAANIDAHWIGTDAAGLFSAMCGCPVHVVNDADAAGMAEMRFGQGKGVLGTAVLITIGSGLGTCVYLPGQERVVEQYASNNAKKRDNLSWEAWAARFSEYLAHLDRLLSPDLFILGGGTSKHFESYKALLYDGVHIVPAQLLNSAGMIGAACYAWECALQTPLKTSN